jgi:hypothetical protein
MRAPEVMLGVTQREVIEGRLARSRQIAGYLGPIVIILALSEAKNLAIWDAGNPSLTYQAGLLWLMGGLAVVLLHNRWTVGWPVTITLVGWFFLVGGMFRMFFPEAQQGNANTPAIGVYLIDVLLLAAGTVMSLKAFAGRGRGLRARSR